MPSRRWRAQVFSEDARQHNGAGPSLPKGAGLTSRAQAIKGKGKGSGVFDAGLMAKDVASKGKSKGVSCMESSEMGKGPAAPVFRADMPSRRWRGGKSCANTHRGGAAVTQVASEAGQFENPVSTKGQGPRSGIVEPVVVGAWSTHTGWGKGLGAVVIGPTGNTNVVKGSCKGRGAFPRREKHGFRAPWAAGIVALSGQGLTQCVCLVAKRNGSLGFPKGSAEKMEKSPMATALREWQEEANLETGALEGLDAEAVMHVDKWNCYYYFATWGGQALAGHPWEVVDDPSDPDPIVYAMWMECREALAHPLLSAPRKELLRKAQRWFSEHHRQ